MAFKVTQIIDGDTFEVSPKWKWNQIEGNIVRPTGFNCPEKGKAGSDAATKKLKDLILNKEVELSKPVNISYGRLVCTVTLDAKDIASFFQEYQI